MSRPPDLDIAPEDFESESEADDESDEFNEEDEELDSTSENRRSRQKQAKRLCPERRGVLKDLKNVKQSSTKTNSKRSGGESNWSENDQMGKIDF